MRRERPVRRERPMRCLLYTSIIGGTVKQFWTDVIWHDEDVLFIDMPPGTGDVALTVFLSLIHI